MKKHRNISISEFKNVSRFMELTLERDLVPIYLENESWKYDGRFPIIKPYLKDSFGAHYED